MNPYVGIALDYDGTLAKGGQVHADVIAALERYIARGHALLLVTGRELDNLLEIFPAHRIFNWIVAENGAVIYEPSTRREILESPPIDERLYLLLKSKGVQPLSRGKVIVSTWEPHERIVLDSIHALQLELHLVFNKGAIMVLPSGVNKGSGLLNSLKRMNLSPKNIVGVGDAENDHSFMSVCGCSVAVANALDAIKERADFVTAGDHGAGVVEVVKNVLNNTIVCPRQHIALVKDMSGRDVSLFPFKDNLLLAGASGSGKSTVSLGLLERLIVAGYQFCVIDPESDYESVEGALTLGSAKRAPELAEGLKALEKPSQNLVLNLSAVSAADRPRYFSGFSKGLLELKARTGRPHLFLVDEAHHVLPLNTPLDLHLLESGVCYVTVFPKELKSEVLKSCNVFLSFDSLTGELLRQFTDAHAVQAPALPDTLSDKQLSLWRLNEDRVLPVIPIPPRKKPRRHRGKYAEGELPEERSFYFRGPEGKLNLRAYNLTIFLQIAEGIDDLTWEYHLKRGDYADWFHALKDEKLAYEAQRIAVLENVDAKETRALIKEAVERRYLAPAKTMND